MNSLTLKNFILKNAFSSFSIQFIGQLSGFILSILLANSLAPNEFGKFYFCFSLVLVMALICQAGTPLFLTKEISVQIAKKNFDLIMNRVLYSLFLIFIFIFFLTFLIYITFNNFDLVFFDQYKDFTYLIIFSVPLIAYINLFAAIYRGLGYVLYALFIDGCLGIMLTLFASYLFSTYTAVHADSLIIFKIYTFSLLFTFFLATIPLTLAFLKNKNKYFYLDINNFLKKIKTWNKSLFYFAVMSIAVVINDHLSILVLGFLHSTTEVGLFKISIQFSLIVIFGLNAINSIIGPKIASLYAKNKNIELQELLSYSVKVSFIYALVILVIIFFVGKPLIILFFGDFYQNAYIPLLVLCFGQFFNVCFGSVGWIVNMTGKEDFAAKVLLLSLIINLVFSLILVPNFGSVGAAIAVSVSLLFWNVCLYLFIVRNLKLNPSIFNYKYYL